jgi:hypothetical protein
MLVFRGPGVHLLPVPRVLSALRGLIVETEGAHQSTIQKTHLDREMMDIILHRIEKVLQLLAVELNPRAIKISKMMIEVVLEVLLVII